MTPFQIPKERVIIDTISLDEEIQLDRAALEEELAPISQLWDEYHPGQTWPAGLPMRLWHPRPGQRYNFLQVAYLQHIIYQGETWAGHNLGFRTALSIHRERQGDVARHRAEATAVLSREGLICVACGKTVQWDGKSEAQCDCCGRKGPFTPQQRKPGVSRVLQQSPEDLA